MVIKKFYTEVLPQDKKAKIAELQQRGEIAGMMGDGINDAPALANVGFAIGTGADVAIESADITLMRGSLQAILAAITISKVTLRNIKKNLFGALIYNAFGIPFSAGALYNSGWNALTAWRPNTCQTIWVGDGLLNSTDISHQKLYSMLIRVIFNT